MADDITLAELGRRIDRVAQDVREDIAVLTSRQEQYVLQRVYAAEQQLLQLRITQLEQRVKEGEDQRRATTRWIVAAIVVPTLTALSTLILPLVVT